MDTPTDTFRVSVSIKSDAARWERELNHRKENVSVNIRQLGKLVANELQAAASKKEFENAIQTFREIHSNLVEETFDLDSILTQIVGTTILPSQVTEISVESSKILLDLRSKLKILEIAVKDHSKQAFMRNTPATDHYKELELIMAKTDTLKEELLKDLDNLLAYFVENRKNLEDLTQKRIL